MEQNFTTQMAKTLRSRRKERGLTQEGVAQMVGFGVNVIKAIEAGRVNVQLGRYLRLLEFFGITLESNVEGDLQMRSA